jgi:hypothetical protein
VSIKKGIISWDEAIKDAHQKLTEAKAYVKRVRDALKVFERNKTMGIPLPTKQTVDR